MKLACFANTLTLGLVAALALVGCTKTPVGVTKLPDQNMNLTGSPRDIDKGAQISQGEKPISDPATTGGLTATDPSKYDTWNADASALSDFTVHFDYDSASIKGSEESKLSSVAEHLKGPAMVALRVEGHCDERGTEEYNRSLGDRRANALREKLAALGVDPQKVVTRSYGEDKPVDQGHNEAAYAKNRRGEFILLTPPTVAQLSKLDH